MPSWDELLNDFNKLKTDKEKQKWLDDSHTSALAEIGRLRGGRNVILYSSAFLQKPNISPISQLINQEDINGFMSVMYRMDWAKGLTLILHTPGGFPNATETIVAYLRSKFQKIEVIIPTLAMSAGTMLSLASDKIVMGRPSQLGPIDPQMQVGGGMVSARAIVDQFDKAKKEISNDLEQAHLWAPILQSLGPALLQEANDALDYSEKMVAEWLEQWMFSSKKDPKSIAEDTAHYFNAGAIHKSHGRRIDREEARSQSVEIEDLEDSQPLQEAVLTAYHLTTLIFEKSPATKLIGSDMGKRWIKNHLITVVAK